MASAGYRMRAECTGNTVVVRVVLCSRVDSWCCVVLQVRAAWGPALRAASPGCRRPRARPSPLTVSSKRQAAASHSSQPSSPVASLPVNQCFRSLGCFHLSSICRFCSAACLRHILRNFWFQTLVVRTLSISLDL